MQYSALITLLFCLMLGPTPALGYIEHVPRRWLPNVQPPRKVQLSEIRCDSDKVAPLRIWLNPRTNHVIRDNECPGPEFIEAK